MTRIDFAFGATDRLRTACQVVRKHYLAGRQIVVYTQDRQQLERFDRLLWSFDATAFIPHVMADDPLADQTPVRLTFSASFGIDANADAQLWLINLDPSCPPNAERFERILEIVSDHDDDKLAARERWRHYKAAGHALHAHNLSGASP